MSDATGVRGGRWDFLIARLESLRDAGILRAPDDGAARGECHSNAAARGWDLLDASSNDYLGYASRRVSRETVFNDSIGAGASRLIHGSRAAHLQLEAELREWIGRESALLFTSGYAANVGVLSSVPQAGDLVLSDALNHASIIDGCRLSRAETRVVPHRDHESLRLELSKEAHKRRCWVVTESYFSMDGDTPHLPMLRKLCDDHGALLIVDEAHALGVFGPGGAGLCHQECIEPDILIGTFGKAIGGQGAFACSEAPVRHWLWNNARSFVYSTAPSPLLAQIILSNIQRVRADDAARTKLSQLSDYVRSSLRNANVPCLEASHGPIIPIILGTPERSMLAAKQLRDRGILVQAIRPPMVEPGLSRIRLTLHANLTESDTQRLIQAVTETCAP